MLLDRRFGLPAGLVRRIDRAQRRFLAGCGGLIAARVRHRRIVDGHGDLRPEHIWLDDKVRIIDCLEFNPRLRVVDPFDEIAYLGLECERLGAAWVGDISAPAHEDDAARRAGRGAVRVLPLLPRHAARAAGDRASL